MADLLQPEHLLIVRPGFEADLAAELKDRATPKTRILSGAVAVSGALNPQPCVFERQRLPHAGFIPEAETRPVSEAVFERLVDELRRARAPWTLQVFTSDSALMDKANGFARAIDRLIARHLPDIAALRRERLSMPDDLVLQIARWPDGVWYSTAPASQCSSPWPGGIPRLKDDPDAPSRSFLKLEEAYLHLNEAPQHGQYAVDLGAAPGGWTLAVARRGCAVTAVDNGPLRLPPPRPGWGRIEYVRANGITFQPRRPVDWLVADMLVAPGVVTGLLRRWIAGRWARRFVVNVKIPQQEAYLAIRPLLQYLRDVPNGSFTVRQLYHDRREVTVMGRLGA